MDKFIKCAGIKVEGRRLINSKFPPIDIFDDVATADSFDAIFEMQSLTNPRLQNEVGNLALLERSHIPFGIEGCSYAVAPFTHINPQGSRFSNGQYGVLYVADTVATALAEVEHHQNAYWSKVSGMSYERIVLRELKCTFFDTDMLSATNRPDNDPIYSKDNYVAAQSLGRTLVSNQCAGLRYKSVRHANAVCWALFTPRHVVSVQQAGHYEMVWNKGITSVSRIISP